MRMLVEDAARACGARLPEGAEGIVCTAVTADSRAVTPGALFVCLKGGRADGHDFAEQAAGKGAAAILAERPVTLPGKSSCPVLLVPDALKALGLVARAWRRRFRGTVIGVTGTAGKTTLKEWLAAALARTGPVLRTEGNFNNQLGLPLSLCRGEGTERFWILEAGISRPGDMEELGAILEPDIACVLNAGEGHAEGLGKLGTAWHKTRLFAALRPGGIAVASADYPELKERALGIRPDTFFFRTAASEEEARAKASRPGVFCAAFPDPENPSLCRLFLRSPRDGGEPGKTPVLTRLAVPLPAPGEASLENCACAALVCLLAGGDPAGLGEALKGVSLPGHRFQEEEAGASLLIDDSYNANPLSMRRMLEAAAARARARGTALGLVLGEMAELGEGAAEAHRELGRQVAGLSPAFFCWTGDHAEAVAEGLGGALPLHVFDGPGELAELLPCLVSRVPAAGGLTILCKGSRRNELDRVLPLCRTCLRPGEN